MFPHRPRPDWDAILARLDSDPYPYLSRMLRVPGWWIPDQKSETVTDEFLEYLENSGLGTVELGDLLLWKMCEAPGCPILLTAPWLCPWCFEGREPHPCCWKVYSKKVPKKKHAMKLRRHGPDWTLWTPVFP